MRRPHGLSHAKGVAAAGATRALMLPTRALMLPTTVAAVAVVYALLMVATGVVWSAVAECGGIGGGGAPAMGEAGREDGREAVREADFEAGRDAGRETRCEEAWEWAWEGDVGWDVARRRMRSWPELSDTMLVTGAARAANVPAAGGAAVSQLKPSPRLPPASPPPKLSLCFSNHSESVSPPFLARVLLASRGEAGRGGWASAVIGLHRWPSPSPRLSAWLGARLGARPWVGPAPRSKTGLSPRFSAHVEGSGA